MGDILWVISYGCQGVRVRYRPAQVGGNPMKSIQAVMAATNAFRCTFGRAHSLSVTFLVFRSRVWPQPRRPLLWRNPTQGGRCCSHPPLGVCCMTLSSMSVPAFINAVMFPLMRNSTTSRGMNFVSCVRLGICPVGDILWVTVFILWVISCGRIVYPVGDILWAYCISCG